MTETVPTFTPQHCWITETSHDNVGTSDVWNAALGEWTTTHHDSEPEAFRALLQESLDSDWRPRDRRRMHVHHLERTCWRVACRVCGDQVRDDETDEPVCFDTEQAAADLIAAFDWFLDAHGEAHCPDHPPTGDERRDLHAPVPGQLDLVAACAEPP